MFLLARVHVSVWWWAGCFINLWVRQGNPQEGQGRRHLGCEGKWRKEGECPRRGQEPGDQEGPEEGLGKGGPNEGEEKREFKLLTLLVFFK